ncbi:TetR/AcrR family transcriptional regulator [Nocardia huaxiensis]|uniref:TetR/AcrR family transcriptional regulator n=1 Tax=Nocardia huaxiensis TaxID=2755382 RepID=A0A7D6V5F2_9NOCA|nr:TetR/AcrR family transcriptional regulator [Nocardia huaxiensis]QLY27881.1 TetR/AcrR family transcriptional regulator [Nocardia huaxiensis]UFS98719.1 TetR/AcrR family transcriptional regulator [Nocardia huaxiensis]
MSVAKTARERARAEITREITDAARRQLAESGAAALSLRAIAREMGMVSSAIYRYFPSRDELLTALIIEAYDAIGAAVEKGVATAENPRARWRGAANAVRAWAIAHPHEYALLYGSPVPGYRAPEATIAPASRVPIAVLGAVHRAWESGTLAEHGDTLDPELAAQAAGIAAQFAPGLPEAVVVRTVIAWTQVFGAVSFELTGQYANTLDPAGPLFDYSVNAMADLIGLRD